MVLTSKPSSKCLDGTNTNNPIQTDIVSPVVRTNPVTGWKSLFGAAHQIEAGWINDVTERESDIIKAYFLQLITDNHDLQVRFKWSKNDLAIWDKQVFPDLRCTV